MITYYLCEQLRNNVTDQSCKSSQKPLVVSGFLVVAPNTISDFLVGNHWNTKF